MTEQHCDVQLSEYSFFPDFFEKYFIHNMTLDFYSDAFPARDLDQFLSNLTMRDELRSKTYLETRPNKNLKSYYE